MALDRWPAHKNYTMYNNVLCETAATGLKTEPDKPNRRRRKRQRMLRHLADTAASLFATQGYEAVTMERIAEQADVARRTLYNHFPAKDAVLGYWVETELARDLARLEGELAMHGSFRERIVCVLDASADWCEKHPAWLRIYLRHGLMNARVAEGDAEEANGSDILGLWQRLIEQGRQAGELDSWCSADRLALWFHHLYLGALLRWLNVPGSSLRDEFRSITRLFVEGVGTTTKSGKSHGRGKPATEGSP